MGLLLALVAVLPACDSSDPTPTPTDSIFFGVNYTRLFATPTAAETQSVRDLWAARNTRSSGAEIVAEQTVEGAQVAIVRHTVSAAGRPDVTHYAAVRIPLGLTSPAPLLIVHHGGDDGFEVVGTSGNTGIVEMAGLYPDLFAQTVQVVPVYRSEELRTTGTSLGGPYVATGDASPWDYDVDDAIASVSAALALYPTRIDPSRRAAIGFSRGGNTAALHAIRDPEIDALVDYYGPTDFYNDDVQLLTTGALTNDPAAVNLPGVQYLRDNVLLPLRGPNGAYNASANYDAARSEIARRSASLFTMDLPDTQVHHHYRDGTVTYAFSEAFAEAANARGTGGSFELFSYGQPDVTATGNVHSPEGLPDSLDRVEAFLLARLGLALARAPVAAAY